MSAIDIFTREKIIRPILITIAIGLLIGTSAAISALLTSGTLIGLLSLSVAILVAIRRPYWIVLFLTAFMPFENFVLKFLPGPDLIYFASRFISEFLIYLTFAALVLRKLLTDRPFRRTPIDGPLFVFIVIAMLSIVVNQSPLFGSLENLRSLLRYLVLFYLIVNLDFTARQVSYLLKIVVFIGLVQIMIGGLQLVTGGAVNDLLLPRGTELEVAGLSRGFSLLRVGREVGSIFGTLGDTIFFSLFMLVVLSVHLGYLKKMNLVNLFFIMIIFAAVNYAYTRAVAFGTLFMLIIFYRLRFGLNKSVLLIIFVLPVIISGAALAVGSSFIYREYRNPLWEEYSVVENITGVFTIEYIHRAQNQRLGALIGIPPTVALNSPILGYGPDEATTIRSLNTSDPSYLLRTVVKKGFEDVYWIAFFAYYGLVGIGTLVFLFYKLYSSAWKIYRTTTYELTRNLAVTVICLVWVVPFLLFFYRAVEFRIFSFYFWLLPALMYGQYFPERTLRRAALQYRTATPNLNSQ